jgi:tetratricopeptide (TPR) repeat protein
VLAQLGEASQAMDRVREGELLLERQADRGMVIVLGPSYHALGRACLLLGHLDNASRLAARALESSSSQPGFMAHALHLFGDIATHPERSDPQTGKAYYRKALAIAEPRGMRPLIAHCHRGLGKLYRCIGQRQSSQKHIATATIMYADMGMQFWSENLETDIGGEVLARDA